MRVNDSAEANPRRSRDRVPAAFSHDQAPFMTRDLILGAALDELKINNLATFTIEKVAARAGVEPHTVRQLWPSTPDLFAATMMSYTAQHLPGILDTGTLYGDLMLYANGYADMVNTPTGRRILDSLIVRPNDWDLAGAREAYFRSRHEWASEIVQRGIDRGECPPATDPRRTIDSLTMIVCLPVLVYDRPVTPDDCEYAVQLVLRGIS
jgi:AcrR family transcriptional regulator